MTTDELISDLQRMSELGLGSAGVTCMDKEVVSLLAYRSPAMLAAVKLRTEDKKH